MVSPKDLRTEPAPVRFIIIALAVTFLTVFVVLPLVVVFASAFSKGISAYFSALAEPEALSAIRLTLLVAAISVSPNLVVGVTAAWEEEAANSLGASGLQTCFRVTLPNIKWGLLYGVLLCNARAMGEFGAVSVVSGHIRGETNTMPLLVEILYNEYQFVASFAIASLLAMLALITLVVKTVLEQRLDDGRSPSDYSRND